MTDTEFNATNGNPLNDDCTKFVRSVMDRLHIPGMSIAVVHHDNVYSEGYGMADFPDTPATPETLYYAASTSKSFCAAAVALLIEDKKYELGWKTPISSLVREDFVLQDDYLTAKVTLEDAACHRTNIPRHEESYYAEDSVRDIVRRLRHLPLIKEGFRTKFEYSNTPWATLSHVIEKVSGSSMEDFLETRLWGPLGMESTMYSTLETRQKAAKKGLTLATGYWWDEKTQKYHAENYMDLQNLAGGAANVSNVLDYAQYLKMMINKSGPLSEKAHTDLRRPRMVVDESWHAPPVFTGSNTYALGWQVQAYRNSEVITHGGDIWGFHTQMLYVPSLSFGVIVFANSSPNGTLADQALVYYLLDNLLGIPASERFDTMKWGENEMKKNKEKEDGIRNRLYPAAAQSRPHSLPFEAYAGKYTSAGYGTLAFSPAKLCPVVPGADPEKAVLRAEATGKAWPHCVELEHISGEHFIAWIVNRRGAADVEGGVYAMNKGVKAEFHVGSDGKVSQLGMAMEPALGDEKIWFQRDD